MQCSVESCTPMQRGQRRLASEHIHFHPYSTQDSSFFRILSLQCQNPVYRHLHMLGNNRDCSPESSVDCIWWRIAADVLFR